MRHAEKIKATLAAAGITYTEFAKLCGLTRQTLYTYFKPDTHLDDFDGGVKCIKISKKIWELCEAKTLPLRENLSVEDKFQRLQELIKSDTMKLQP